MIVHNVILMVLTVIISLREIVVLDAISKAVYRTLIHVNALLVNRDTGLSTTYV